MKNEDMRDETAQELIDVALHGVRFIDRLEEAWQEVNAEEKGSKALSDARTFDEFLGEGYWVGQAELILRVANCLLDATRHQAQQLDPEQARVVQSMKVEIKEEWG